MRLFSKKLASSPRSHPSICAQLVLILTVPVLLLTAACAPTTLAGDPSSFAFRDHLLGLRAAVGIGIGGDIELSLSTRAEVRSLLAADADHTVGDCRVLLQPRIEVIGEVEYTQVALLVDGTPSPSIPFPLRWHGGEQFLLTADTAASGTLAWSFRNHAPIESPLPSPPVDREHDWERAWSGGDGSGFVGLQAYGNSATGSGVMVCAAPLARGRLVVPAAAWEGWPVFADTAIDFVYGDIDDSRDIQASLGYSLGFVSFPSAVH